MKIKVSDLIVKYLERLGVEFIFGMPGAHILPVYNSLYDSNIQSVLAKHEQGAAFMAGGCARASNKISACITTAGPGATNLVTGIANAYADKLPIIVITGEAPTYIFGKGGLQESSGEGGSIDQYALFKGITRYNKVIERTDYLENVLNQVSKILLSDNSGPVLLSFPYNVQKEMLEESILDNVITQRQISAIRNNALPLNDFREDFAQLLKQSNQPVIIAGHGCIKADAQKEIDELSERLNIPVTTSLKGKGVISEQSTRSLGSLGVTSYSEARDYIIKKADLLIFLGAGFNERTSYLWDKTLLKNKKIIQVDTSPEQLEKVFKADLPILGDIKQIISGVLNHLNTQAIQKKSYSKIQQNISTESDAASFINRFALIKTFFDELENHFFEDMMIFDDNIIFAQNFFNVSNGNRYYSNSGISSLGHAIPAAIGARFALNKPTLAVLGDGGFQMCCMELMTAVNYNIPLTVIMFNNATMGLIRKNQFQQYEKRFIDCDFVNPDYKLLAQSFGINYKKIEEENDLDGLFNQVDYMNSINLIEIIIDKDLFPTYSSKR